MGYPIQTEFRQEFGPSKMIQKDKMMLHIPSMNNRNDMVRSELGECLISPIL